MDSAVAADVVTHDALSGHFKIYQLKDGHRFSTDDLLVAWYTSVHARVPTHHKGRYLDLGSGVGSVSTAVAWRFPQMECVTVEAQPTSVALARRSVQENGIGERFDIREGDFREGVLDPEECFELITGSPPYFPLNAGIPAKNEQKRACRFEVRGDISDYCKVARQHLAPLGQFFSVFPLDPEHQRARVFSGAQRAGLKVVRYRPVCLKEGKTPLLGVFEMMRIEDALAANLEYCVEESALIIRRLDGSVHPEYQAAKELIGFKS